MKKNRQNIEQGFTFIEILIAIIIMGMVFSSMMAALNTANSFARRATNRIAIINSAQDLMEFLRSKVYGNLNSYNGFTDTVSIYQNDDTQITAQRSVVVSDVTYTGIAYKKVTVSVSWNSFGTPIQTEINTLRGLY